MVFTFFKYAKRKIKQPSLTIIKLEQILVNLAGGDLKRIMANVLHAMQWKHLQIAIGLCGNFRKIFYIFMKNCNGNAASVKVQFYDLVATKNVTRL